MQRHIADRRIWFGHSGNNVPRIKTFLDDKERGLTPETILFADEASTNEDAKNVLKEIFGGHAPRLPVRAQPATRSSSKTQKTAVIAASFSSRWM
jgi:hypothetical protein